MSGNAPVKTFREAIAEAIREEMLRDKNVFLIGVEVGQSRGGTGGVLKGMAKAVGRERIVDTPLAEAVVVGVAAGAAMVGMRPVAELLSGDYIPYASDEIVNTAAKMRYSSGGKLKIPMVLRIAFGAADMIDMWESQELEAWMVHTPGLKVIMPSIPYDAKGLLKSAIRDDNPVIFFEQKLLYGVEGRVPDEEYLIPIGKADIKREGKDVTVIATGIMVHEALGAAEKLEKEGIEAEILDPRTLLPVDKNAILKSVEKTGRVVITHRATKTGGIGAEFAAIIAEEGWEKLKAPIKRVTAPDTPLPWSPPLRQFYLPNADSVVKAVRGVMECK
jgi:pyruvate dehydrogenase E1 component beta subunit